MKSFNRLQIALMLAAIAVCTVGTAQAQFPASSLVIGNLAPGDSIVITFEVEIDDPFPMGDTEVANQGTVSGNNFANVLTDDPDTAAPNDATVTPVQEAIPVPNNLLFLAQKNLTLAQATTDGKMHSNKDLTIKPGKNNTYTGDLTAVGKISIGKLNTVDGDVTAGSTVTNAGTVTGTITQNTSVPSVPLPPISFSAGTQNVTVPVNGIMYLPPGSYGNVSALKNARLEMSGGEYFVKSLTIGELAVLALSVSADDVEISGTGLLSFGKKSQVEITPGGESATADVIFNRFDGGTVKILGNAKVLGSIICPGAQVSIASNSRFKGAIAANVINVAKGVVALYHTSTMSLPKLTPEEEVEGDVVDLTAIPENFELGQNYPNPFNPNTTIVFGVPRASNVTLTIFNLKGQVVRVLQEGPVEAGYHEAEWDATDSDGLRVASGIYIYRLQADGFVANRRLILMK
jgi:cytoskeletal protein CcmA (bactofilin family)